MREPSRSRFNPPNADEIPVIDCTSLDRFVPPGAALALVFMLLIILYGRW